MTQFSQAGGGGGGNSTSRSELRGSMYTIGGG
jgi:hypothetical protein